MLPWIEALAETSTVIFLGQVIRINISVRSVDAVEEWYPWVEVFAFPPATEEIWSGNNISKNGEAWSIKDSDGI